MLFVAGAHINFLAPLKDFFENGEAS